MQPENVIEVLDALEYEGIDVWLSGGWGIDALLGEQTRPHDDLDVAVDRRNLERTEAVLAQQGYRADTSAEPGLPARLVLVDDTRREVDLHPLVFDPTGNGWQQLSDHGRHWGRWGAQDLTARGIIVGRAVRCISAALQFRFHLGYEWTEKDRQDLSRLQERFGVGPPLGDL